jgi:hypothetical protein
MILVSTPQTSGQIVYGQPTSGSAQVVYYNWKADIDGIEETVSQFAMPLSGFFPLRDNLDLTFYAVNSSNTYDDPLTEYKLSGLSDLRLQANHSFADDRLLVSLGLNLPTGKKELDGEQQEVLLALAQNYYEFPVRKFGEGLGLSLLVGGAVEVRDGLRAGGGITYQYAGKYTPYADFILLDTVAMDTTAASYEDYDPGDMFSINGGFDLERGPMVWSVDMIFTQYVPDKLADSKIFRQSRQFDWRLRGLFTGSGVDYSGMIRYVWRGQNRLYNELGEWDATRKLYGNEFQLAGEARYAFGTDWFAAPSLDLRLISGAQVSELQEIGSASVFGVGAGVGRNLGENFSGQLGFKYYTGSADGGGIDLSGYRLTFGVSAAM